MATQHPQGGSQGSDETAELVRSVALSSARLWEDFLERLARVERTQMELTEAISQLKGALPASSLTPTLSRGALGASRPASPASWIQ